MRSVVPPRLSLSHRRLMFWKQNDPGNVDPPRPVMGMLAKGSTMLMEAVIAFGAASDAPTWIRPR